MHHPRDPAVGCNGKQKLGRAIAKQIAGRKRLHGGPKPLPYRCAFCGFWHIGNSIKTDKGRS